jgi:hypothetical protein
MLSLPELAHATSAHDIASEMTSFDRLCMASPDELAPRPSVPDAKVWHPSPSSADIEQSTAIIK